MMLYRIGWGRLLALIICAAALPWAGLSVHAAEVEGVAVTPHTIVPTMKYRQPRDGSLAARIQLFVRGTATSPRFNGKTPAELLAENQWAWHDLHTALPANDDELVVWSFNGKSNEWGTGSYFELEADEFLPQTIGIQNPLCWISAVTFLSTTESAQPNLLVMHFANQDATERRIRKVRLWWPKDRERWQVLSPQHTSDVDLAVAPHDKGFLVLDVGSMPLTYVAIEVETDGEPLWTHLRIKAEQFDISGGWIGDDLTDESYLKLLKGMHVNTGHFQSIAGYTDQPERYQQYPLKLFHRLWPLEQWDTDELLPKIHAVEFLGEPQYGGGRPVAPQEVFDQLLPYRSSRLATTVTHSEERIWRWYAGLSDYPHYDAYRVVAPAADAWSQYDRWSGKRIRWGAPLETIGALCRSLRELNRPLPCAYWSQGPHDGWQGRWDGRHRRSPTPDELRAQAMHALASRITSLYWFNLSRSSLDAFPDTWEPMRRIGREIQMLAPFYLAGDAYQFERRLTSDGHLDWELASIASPDAAILFALDTAYVADTETQEFRFGDPRPCQFFFRLPPWLRPAPDVFRVDADGIHTVAWRVENDGVWIETNASRDAIFVATTHENVRREIEARRQQALATEQSFDVPSDR
jgi:hypothetical protein